MPDLPELQFDNTDLPELSFNDIPEKKIGFFGKIPVSEYQQGKRNIIGNIVDRPAAAVRGFIENLTPGGKTPVEGLKEGFKNPATAPRFQEALLDKYYGTEKPSFGKFLGGFGVSALGLGADIMTDPLTYAMGGISKVAGPMIANTRFGRYMTEVSKVPVQRIPKMVKQELESLAVDSGRLTKNITNLENDLTNTIRYGISKGIRPTVSGKVTINKSNNYYSKVSDSIKYIVQNKDKLGFVDDLGNPIVKNPENVADWAKAIESSKRNVYQRYHDLAVQAGDKGALFDAQPVISKLDKVSKDLSYNPQARDYAKRLISDIGELQGASPEIVEKRISDLNKSLSGFYAGRVDKVKAEIDASVANLMRENLDNSITQATGKQYQELKNIYGSLKTAEKEINHRAVVFGRQNQKSLADLTDIFSGGKIINGLLTANPTEILTGAAQMGIKNYFKKLNSPDFIVKKMFSKADRLVENIAKLKTKEPPLLDAELVTQIPQMKFGKFLPPSTTKQLEYKPIVLKQLLDKTGKIRGKDFIATLPKDKAFPNIPTISNEFLRELWKEKYGD